MVKKPDTNKARLNRHKRVRGKVSGTAARPRLDKDIDGYGGNKDAARKVGALIAKRAAEKNITEVVFDRGGYIFHGRVKELAEGAREGGLKF